MIEMPLEGVGAPVLVKAPLPVGFTWTVVFPDAFPLISSRSVNWFDSGPPAVQLRVQDQRAVTAAVVAVDA